MSMMTELRLDELCREDRVQLAGELWDSIESEAATVPLTEGQQHELQRRMEEHSRNPVAVVPWEQVKAAAIARLKR